MIVVPLVVALVVVVALDVLLVRSNRRLAARDAAVVRVVRRQEELARQMTQLQADLAAAIAAQQ